MDQHSGRFDCINIYFCRVEGSNPRSFFILVLCSALIYNSFVINGIAMKLYKSDYFALGCSMFLINISWLGHSFIFLINGSMKSDANLRRPAGSTCASRCISNCLTFVAQYTLPLSLRVSVANWDSYIILWSQSLFFLTTPVSSLNQIFFKVSSIGPSPLCTPRTTPSLSS